MPVVKGKLEWWVCVGRTDVMFRGVTVGCGLVVGAEEYPVPAPDQPVVDQINGVVVLLKMPVDAGGGGGCPVPQGAVGPVPGGKDLV